MTTTRKCSIMCDNNLALHDCRFSRLSILLEKSLATLHNRNEIFPKSDLGLKQNYDYTHKRRQIAEGRRKQPAGLHTDATLNCTCSQPRSNNGGSF